MLTKHFFKVLIIFIFMIVLGMVGVFAVNYLSKTQDPTLVCCNTATDTKPLPVSKTIPKIPVKPRVAK